MRAGHDRHRNVPKGPSLRRGRELLEHLFTLRFRYLETPLPLGKTGKLKEFVCLVE